MFHIIHFETIDSTNNYAKIHINELNHYDVIQADFQTSGRGRRDHQWVAEAKSHLMSTLVLKETIDIALVQQLTQVCAVSIVQLCQSLNIEAKIKWPNDIYVGDQKLVGILIETIYEKELKGIVIGAGMNIEDVALPNTATCLKRLGSPLSIAETLNQYLDYFHQNYLLFKNNQYHKILAYANAHAYLTNKQVTLSPWGNVQVGELLEDGRIEILANEEIHYIHVNEFSLSKKM